MNPMRWLRKRWEAKEFDDMMGGIEEASKDTEAALKDIRSDAAEIHKSAAYLRRQREKNHWTYRVNKAWKGGAT